MVCLNRVFYLLWNVYDLDYQIYNLINRVLEKGVNIYVAIFLNYSKYQGNYGPLPSTTYIESLQIIVYWQDGVYYFCN